MGVLAGYEGNLKLPANFNRYLLLSADMHVAGNSAQAFVYAKPGPAMAFGFIHPPPSDHWVGTRVALGEGEVGGRLAMSVPMLKYLIERAEYVDIVSKQRSAQQNEKIIEAMKANPERAAASETLRATAADIERFGFDRVFPDEPREV